MSKNRSWWIICCHIFLLLLQAGCNDRSTFSTELPSNEWTMILKEDHGARRFSSFRYANDINRFLLWGFHGFYTEYGGNPENPWTGNKEYDIVAFNPESGLWGNHLPLVKQEEWSDSLPPMHLMNYYQGITPGYYRLQLKEREGVVRPDLNIVGDQVTYDSKRRRMIYFTGGVTFAYYVESREWQVLESDITPPPVSFGSLCYDPFGDRVILFGGGHVAEPGPGGQATGYTGTWAYDCSSGEWSELNTGENPPPRMCTRMVCDTRNKAMIVFGGDGQSRWLADTWKFDLKRDRWSRSVASGAPAARAGHFTVYDPSSDLVIIGGGYNSQELTDMWGYDTDSGSWHKIRGEVPAGWYITADIMPRHGIILLTTSIKREGDTRGCNEIYPVRTTWAYKIDKGSLIDSDTIPGPEQELLKRPVEMAVIGTEPDSVRSRMQMEKIRSMPVNRWIHFDDPGRIAPLRTWGSCAFDTEKGRIIYWGGGHCGYGGNDYDLYDVEQNTWISSPVVTEYPERAWDKGINPGGVTFSGNPWIRHGRKIYAWDPVSRKIINTKTVYLTGGYEPDPLKDIEPVGAGSDESISGRPYYLKWTTWTYDEENEDWKIVCSGLPGLDLLVQTPKGVMAVDYNWGAVDSRQRPDLTNVIDSSEWTTFEDRRMVDNSVYLLDVAGKKWNKLTRSGPWPQNLYEMTALVYDSRRDQLILHGGGAERDELWRFPLSTCRWERIVPQFGPGTGNEPPVCNREAVYIPGDDIILTAGTPAKDTSKAGFWAYHIGENRWYRVEVDLPDGKTMRDVLGQNRAWTYDPVHDIIFMILGKRGGDTAESDLYGIRYRYRR